MPRPLVFLNCTRKMACSASFLVRLLFLINFSSIHTMAVGEARDIRSVPNPCQSSMGVCETFPHVWGRCLPGADDSRAK